MSLSMEPSHTEFEEKHLLLDSHGNVILPPPLSSSPPSSRHIGIDEDVDTNDSVQPPAEINVPVLSRYSSERSLVHSTYSPSTIDLKAYATSAADARSIMNVSSAPSEASTFYHPEHSIYTMHSVLMADGILNQVDPSDFQDMPARYDKSSVKAKVTWFGALCLAGIGMFVEALVIITTGQIKTIWHGEYPECWTPTEDQHCPSLIFCCGLFPNTPTDSNGNCAVPLPNDSCQADGTFSPLLLCNSRVTTGVSYSEFAGIMAGMLIFGAACDLIGRKNAGTLTSLLMIVGIAGMILFDNANTSTLFIILSVFFGVFGMGVGGEYPLTASGAAEYHVGNTEAALQDDQDRHQRRVLMEAAKTVRRGETIALVFAMQGVGAVLGSVILLCLIYASNQTTIQCDKPSSNSTGNNPDALSGIWRSFYLIGLLAVFQLLLYRSLILEEDTGHNKLRERQQRREDRLGKGANSKWKILKFYAPRLVGTGGNWFLWDVAFYGLKLYSGPIFKAINPGGGLLVQNGWLLFNNLCALMGYYCAARVIDIPGIGRKKLQMASFAVCAALFMTTAAIFDTGKTQTLMFLYFASSFFGNFGVNVTTYVVAAETYPSELRATCHGLSAFMGKLGALLATILFDSMSAAGIFWACGVVSIVGFFVTYIFTVDLTRVSLAELDAQLELFLEGKLARYKGKLNAPQHLSNFELWTGRHGEYDPPWATKLLGKSSHDRRKKMLSSGSPSLFGALSEDNRV